MIKMIWPQLGKEVRVEILDTLNPTLCEHFLKQLPLKSVQSHAVVCGQQMYFPYLSPPVPEDAAWENMSEQPVGRINIEPKFHYMSLNYGPNHEAVPALAVGQVWEEDFGILEQVGRIVCDNLLFSTSYIYVVVEEVK